MPRRPNTSPQTRRVLAELLASMPRWRYGYDLSRATGLKSGTLYPLLMRLSDQQLLESRWETSPERGKPPRHAYRLTAAGRQLARSQAAEEAQAEEEAARRSRTGRRGLAGGKA